jgi:hypothetical protein
MLSALLSVHQTFLYSAPLSASSSLPTDMHVTISVNAMQPDLQKQQWCLSSALNPRA